jgi:GMP synthase (glutamine-hydrolysing)
MRVLAFRHVPHEGAGSLETVLSQRGIQLQYADLYQPGFEQPGFEPPDPAAFQGLVFLGGPMSANDPLPFLRWEMRALRDAMDRHQPVLGICLGAQLIAKALGARVHSNPQKEIGFFDVNLTPAAAEDPLFAAWPGAACAFHWHGETFDLPQGAVLLASSALCRNQAFRIGESTYGLQFHPEITPAMIAGWCAQDASCGEKKELDRPLEPSRNAPQIKELAELLFTSWSELLQRSHYPPASG